MGWSWKLKNEKLRNGWYFTTFRIFRVTENMLIFVLYHSQKRESKRNFCFVPFRGTENRQNFASCHLLNDAKLNSMCVFCYANFFLMIRNKISYVSYFSKWYETERPSKISGKNVFRTKTYVFQLWLGFPYILFVDSHHPLLTYIARH